MAPRSPRRVGCVAVVVLAVLVLAAGIGGYRLLRDGGLTTPVPGLQRCEATAGDATVVLDLDQAHLTSIIVGLSVRRGLAPRAASIAMATVYQETGIRNLDYGDRDSVGLFQQRPSQGWGTVKQLMDPYYATGKFYDALVKVRGWESGDITEVAQKVQRSGYPEAYRDHEADARVLASALTGHSPAGFTCLERENHPGKAEAAAKALKKTFGALDVSTAGSTVSVTARTKTLAWSYAHFAVANTALYGVSAVGVGERQWTSGGNDLPTWSAGADSRTVVVTVR